MSEPGLVPHPFELMQVQLPPTGRLDPLGL